SMVPYPNTCEYARLRASRKDGDPMVNNFHSMGRRTVLAILVLLPGAEAAEPSSGLPERHGLRCISQTEFPVPAEATVVPLAGADFETEGKMPM
ncbi:hypothetical protein RZS08_63750, partial [Arthrospira platensis SPKY1]|nr:hypothetical protein [Arthrospira platensis SPKY1]